MAENIYLFTDGACTSNGKKNARCSSAYLITTINKEIHRHAEVTNLDGKCTNQIGELTAILLGLSHIQQNLNSSNLNITVVTDSQYSIDCLTTWIASWIKNNWMNSKKQPVINKSIIQNIYNILTELKKNNTVNFRHVRSHLVQPDPESGEYFLWKGNDTVDKLATSVLNTH